MKPSDDGANRRALQAILDGYRGTALLHAAAKLGIADVLAAGPASTADLARALDAHGPSLERLLRGLTAMGVLQEMDGSLFALAPLGAALRKDAEDSVHPMAILCGDEYMAAWAALAEGVRTGSTPFDHVFGMTPWEHRARNPELNACFNQWLAGATAPAAENIAASFDFSAFGTVADVGGGHGALLAAILRRHPGVRGILFDQPHVVGPAKEYLERNGVGGRATVAAGDFFAKVDIKAHAIVLKSVIHDWDDEKSTELLRNCRRALDRDERLLLVERLLPRRAADDPHAVMIDLHMMAVTGGRERTEAEFRALLATAGFRTGRVVATACGFSIVEGVPE